MDVKTSTVLLSTVRLVIRCDGQMKNKINKEKAENIEKVQGAFLLRSIPNDFGTGTVNKIYDEVVAQVFQQHLRRTKKAEAAKQNWFQRAIRSFGDISFHCFQQS